MSAPFVKLPSGLPVNLSHVTHVTTRMARKYGDAIPARIYLDYAFSESGGNYIEISDEDCAALLDWLDKLPDWAKPE